jgi:hypothetical protein
MSFFDVNNNKNPNTCEHFEESGYSVHKICIIYLWSKVVSFCLAEISQTMEVSCRTLCIFRKLSMSRGALTWLVWDCLGAMVWKLLNIEPFSQWKLNKIKTENCIGILGEFVVFLESPRWVRFNRVHFTIFRAKVRKILIFGVDPLSKIQPNWWNWVWMEKSVGHSMCSHLGQAHTLN